MAGSILCPFKAADLPTLLCVSPTLPHVPTPPPGVSPGVHLGMITPGAVLPLASLSREIAWGKQS